MSEKKFSEAELRKMAEDYCSYCHRNNKLGFCPSCAVEFRDAFRQLYAEREAVKDIMRPLPEPPEEEKP